MDHQEWIKKYIDHRIEENEQDKFKIDVVLGELYGLRSAMEAHEKHSKYKE